MLDRDNIKYEILLNNEYNEVLLKLLKIAMCQKNTLKSLNYY